MDLYRAFAFRRDSGEKISFEPSEMRSKLLPYFELTSAVRAGDLHEFALVVEKHKATFEKDNVFNLITRLRRNVIRTGLAKVNVAYSKISLNDIALKLGLQKDVDMNNTTSNNINSEGAIECVVAKAIRDGAVDAQIDFETGIMTSNETKDDTALRYRVKFSIKESRIAWTSTTSVSERCDTRKKVRPKRTKRRKSA